MFKSIITSIIFALAFSGVASASDVRIYETGKTTRVETENGSYRIKDGHSTSKSSTYYIEDDKGNRTRVKVQDCGYKKQCITDDKGNRTTIKDHR
ncbi:hypothetical protein [Endozoicomonas sp. ALB032]|uniref:hypothetical protein n=1 Tax=Endozoicomonas sp. ALB032 TaxID=3403082 RepID=UPI003BB5C84F